MGGISASTSTNLLYGTNAYLTVNAIDIGATLGDVEISWGVTQYFPDLAQALGPVAGTGKVTEGMFSIGVTIAEWSWAILSASLGSIGAVSTGDSYKFGGGALANITEVSNVIVTGVTRNDGKEFKATIKTAYVEVGNVTMSKGSETGLELTFHGLYVVTTPSTMPGYIEIEKG